MSDVLFMISRSLWSLMIQVACVVFILNTSILPSKGANVGYTYDSLNRLTQATYPDGSVVAYTYDAAGNRLTQIVTQVAPNITAQPQPQTVALGSPASFSVTATGSALLTYQWLFNTSPISGQTASTLTLANVTATQAGSYSVVVTNGAGSVTSNAATLTIQGSFSQWASLYFDSTQLANPAISGLTATPQSDSVPNLFKYLCNINPSTPMSVSDRAALPTVGMTANGGINYLTLTYRQNSLMTGITVNVQTSTDLQSWTTVNPPDRSLQVGTDATTGDPIMEVGVVAPGTTKQFIRLNVTSP